MGAAEVLRKGAFAASRGGFATRLAAVCKSADRKIQSSCLGLANPMVSIWVGVAFAGRGFRFAAKFATLSSLKSSQESERQVLVKALAERAVR